MVCQSPIWAQHRVIFSSFLSFPVSLMFFHFHFVIILILIIMSVVVVICSCPASSDVVPATAAAGTTQRQAYTPD